MCVHGLIYTYISSVNKEIAEHLISLHPESKPKQQNLRRMKLEVSLKVKQET